MDASKMTAALFEEVFSNHVILSHMDGGFTPKNFAVNKKMVALAAEGFLLIDGFVCRNIDMDAYKSSRFAKTIKVRRIEWGKRLDPTHCANRCDHVLDESEPTETALMIQILRDNAKNVKCMVLELSLDVDFSHAHVAGRVQDERRLYANASAFLETLPQCVELEALGVTQRDFVPTYARPHSLQVKVMEVVKTLPKLVCLSWNGNMSEQAWKATNDGEVAMRAGLCDYLPRSLRTLIISDELLVRMFFYKEHDSGGLKALMRNQDKQFSNVKILHLPSSFWGLGVEAFTSYVAEINAGDLAQIGFADYFKLKEYYGNIQFCRKSQLAVGRLCPPRLDLLLGLLTREITVDLNECRDETERQVRLDWAGSLTNGGLGFYKCEREEIDGYAVFTLWKKYTGRDEARRGSAFRVILLV